MFTLNDAKETLYRTVLDRRSDTAPQDTPAIFDSATNETAWGWVFYYNNAKYLESQDHRDMWVGQGPIFFNRSTGDIRVFGSGCDVDRELRDYESELAADNGYWCLWITDTQSLAEAIARLKNALAINTTDAVKLLPQLPCCLLSGKRRHLEWLASKFGEYSLGTRVELHLGYDPASKPFLLPEEMINPSAAQAYHHKWDVRGY